MKLNTIYATWAPLLTGLGLEPRPIKFGTKACKELNWSKPNNELPQGLLDDWIRNRADYGIGLRMGTKLADGTCLGALDVDHDKYVPLATELLNNPLCGRVGSKGIVYFFRYPPLIKPDKLKFRVNGRDEFGQVAELLLEGSQVVIPPTVHPDTERPYRWIGTPLHEMDFSQLPYIGE